MILDFVAKLNLNPKSINVGAQTRDNSFLITYGMVVADFLLWDS